MASPGAQPRPIGRRLRAPLAWAVVAIAALLLVERGLAGDRSIDILALGDWGTGDKEQKAVAAAMASYVERNRIGLDAVLLLGDNFYEDLEGGVDDPQWRSLFESMYDPRRLSVPFYAVLGNHDYEDGKERIQLAYAKENPDSRFKLPRRWYRVDLPAASPLVTLLALDSNAEELGEARWSEQKHWLQSELSRAGAGRWTVCFAHHPLLSDGEHGDDKALKEAWNPLFRKHGVEFYLAGHDHTLQHLEVPGWPTWFIVSGGGGNDTYDVERKERSKFGRGTHGFVHLRFSEDAAKVTFVGGNGETLHVAERRALEEDAQRAAGAR